MTNVIEVASNVIQIILPTPFQIGPVNVYVIREEGTVTLVDAGPNTDEAWKILTESLETLSLTPAAIDQIFLTHHHPDHTGLIGRFTHQPKVLGHPRCVPWLTRKADFMARYNDYFRKLAIRMGVPKEVTAAIPTIEEHLIYSGTSTLDIEVEEGAVIHGLENWEILYTPGHAYTHLSLYRPSDGILVGGDVLLEHVSSNAILEPPYHDNEQAPFTLLDYRQTMEQLLTIRIERVLPGHGQPFGGAYDLIRERLNKQSERRERVRQLIGSDAKTTFTLGTMMFPKVYRSQLDLVLSEVQGYLDWLTLSGDIRGYGENGEVLYQQI